MSQAAVATRAEPAGGYPIETFLADIAGIDFSTDLTDRRRRSRDYFWYSPILYEELKDKLADVVVSPKNEAEVIRVAAACARHRIPLTPRGGATGNYGQCVPLTGGVVLDMAAMNRIEWQKPGRIRVAGRRQAVRHRRRDPAERLGTAHASLDQARRADRRLRRGRQRRRRQRHLWRHARARQHPGGAHRHARGNAAGDRTARRRLAEDQPRLRHHRHHHGARNAAGAGAAVDRRDRGVRRPRRRRCGSATPSRSPTASSRSSCRRSSGRCRATSPPIGTTARRARACSSA